MSRLSKAKRSQLRLSKGKKNSVKIEKEEVNHPDHYGGDTPYEVIKVLRQWLTHEAYIGFCKGQIYRYLARAGKKEYTMKDGSKQVSRVKDAEKAQFYMNALVKAEQEGSING